MLAHLRSLVPNNLSVRKPRNKRQYLNSGSHKTLQLTHGSYFFYMPTYTEQQSVSFNHLRKPSMNPLSITLSGVTKTYQQGTSFISVLNNIDAKFVQGDTYAITGSSGSGKSTLLHIIAGLETPDHGTVTINDQNGTSISSKEYARQYTPQLGIVFQQPHLINELSVLENVMLKGLIAGQPLPSRQKRVLEMLDAVGLVDKAHVMPSTLSGGQQQRIAILRALFNQPAILLADEPTGNLDAQTGKATIDFLLSCQHIWNMGLIICSHDEHVIQKMHHRLILKMGSLTHHTQQPQ